ncbi:MAG: chemotaxis protein CheB, partial [Parasphingorhabdus sp.]|uniref:chemotaxis protein CheB n=1 Tax=Parasphingorhabdus sp. TaxID=2709688 RepID=UPI003002D9AF
YQPTRWNQILAYFKPAYVSNYLTTDNGVVDRWPGGSIRLVDRDPINGARPSADLLFSSLAKVGGANVIGALLSGTGSDGVAGLNALRQSGGLTLCQAPDDAMVPETVEAAIAKGAVEHQLPVAKLAELMLDKCKGNASAA